MTLMPSHGQDVLGLLATAPACRVEELPRPAETDDAPARRDLGVRQRFTGVVAAYHAGQHAPASALVMAWRRAGGRRHIDFYAGGTALGEETSGRVTTIVPSGGLGRSLPSGGLLAELGTLPFWVRISGNHDGLLGRRPGDEHDEMLRPSLEDGLLRVWRSPFAWLLIAQPLSPAWVATEAGRVAELEHQSRARDAPRFEVRTTQLRSRHHELRRAESTGMWRVHLLAGGESPGATASVAGLVAASADLAALPYALAPRLDAASLIDSLRAAPVTGTWETPFDAGSELVTALIPGLTGEIPGTRLALRSTFDMTPESTTTRHNGGEPILLGRVLDHNQADGDDVALPRDSLNRHTFVAGATGSGKSQTIRALLTEASQAGLPWLVVEPAKAEYRLMAARLGTGSVITVRPGEPDGVPAGINPLEPAPGFPLQTHADLVRALFIAAFQAEEPFPQVLSTALTRCYDELGWDLALGEAKTPGVEPAYPTLTDLQRTAEKVVLDVGYGKEISDNVLGFIRVRLASLRLGTTGRFFEGGHPLAFGPLLERNVVFEIEDVGDDQDKAFLMGTVLIRLVEHLRVEHRGRDREPARLRHLTVIEEAHRLLRRTEQPGPAAHAVELFASLLAEIRAYGEGLVVAEQIPNKLVPDVIKNTAVKIVHRLPAKDDREAVGATMNLTDAQSTFLVTLPPGEAALFADGMDYPLLVRMPDGSVTETSASAVTAGPGMIIGRRSATCGADCRLRACTLREVRAAQRLPETQPWLRLWAELAVLAHLTGWPMPVPLDEIADRLGALPARLRDCAVSHAVDSAVHARVGATATGQSPAELAAHVNHAMLAQLRKQWICARDERGWIAAPYRWCPVLDALKDLHRLDPGAGRHPCSDEWEQEYGRVVPGQDVLEQFDAVRSWVESDLRNTDATRTIAHGGGPSSAIETAVGARRTAPDWTDRLNEALAVFLPVRWVDRYLPADSST